MSSCTSLDISHGCAEEKEAKPSSTKEEELELTAD